MTKVIMNTDLLVYRQEMKESLRQVVRQNSIGGVRQADRSWAPFISKGALVPPDIACISLEGYRGQDDDFIGIMVFHDFGIASLNVTILDDRGNRIESGDAFPYPDNPELWWFLPTVQVPSGITVNVQVTAIDCMGGICTRRIARTTGEEEEW
jgi:hypothetical protein